MTRSQISAFAVFGILFGLSSVTGMTVEAATFKVDCDKNGGPSIQDRLDNNAGGGDTILVSGDCTENVRINKDGISLVADTGGASITGASTTSPVIRVSGLRTTITGFTLVGGSIVIQVRGGASATIRSNDISGANRTSGILLTQNSYAFIGSSDETGQNNIHDNPTGVNIRLGSSGDVFFNLIHDNSRGISVNANGAVDMSDNKIEDNSDRGLSVSANSTANMSTVPATAGGPNIFNRNGIGVRCSLGAALTGNPQIFGIGPDANGTNTTLSGSCRVSRSLGF